jgi:hypothetical protein
MDIAIIKAFFMWCTIINGALMIFTFLICIFAREWAYSMHSKWFPISREAFNVAIYCFLGLYKMFVIVFNLVPFIALAIIG